jgi:superfamily I DNA/RNA helicase/DNA polymerase III epsilon subunit-like protein
MAVLDLASQRNTDLRTSASHSPSLSQRRAIQADLGPLLVLAGPGAGKTLCLIERIRYLIEKHGIDPARILAFTFTNKAAEEIASRLAEVGPGVARVKRGTIHSFCAEMLREFGERVGLARGFGIADEAYQLGVIARIDHSMAWPSTLTAFGLHRFSDTKLPPVERAVFEEYERYLTTRNVVDFDMLLLKAAQLLESTAAADVIRDRWSALLVDEFQDLNSAQYRIVHELARTHENVFAVGDHEQSIFSWTGADPKIFTDFMNNFHLSGEKQRVHLQENHRCPREVFEPARALVSRNPDLFSDYKAAAVHRTSGYPVEAREFENEDAECAWIVDDILRDRTASSHSWGDVALLYRKHWIGECIESAFLNAGIPCRLVQGRALAENPVVKYVIGGLRVIAYPDDEICRDNFFSIVLPRPLFEEARAQAQAARHTLPRRLREMAAARPRGDETTRQIRRALAAWKNLEATGRNHETLSSLLQELVAQRIRRLRSVLDERHDDLSDPVDNPEVVRLADRLRHARERDSVIWIDRLGGMEIALKQMLIGCDFRHIELGGARPVDAECLERDDCETLGLPLGLFKALQLLEIGDFTTGSRNFTAVDLETTHRDAKLARIVEIAAVRVRDGKIVDEFTCLVNPGCSIPAESIEVHQIHDSDVESALPFEAVWNKFTMFCGDDIVVAHNGYDFDFPVMRRMCEECGKKFDLCTYDTLPLARDLYPTSARLGNLAMQFGIDTGRAHRAPDDARTLARLFVRLDDAKLCRARKAARVDLLDRLVLALALSDENSLCDEARLFMDIAHLRPFWRSSGCLDEYERERAGDDTMLPVDEIIEKLGGAKLMEHVRSERSADQRNPGVMTRLRRLLDEIPEGTRDEQIGAFLERAVLSKFDGNEPHPARVNLLTLHSTKGLEFSRVYVVGVEDAEFPGTHSQRDATEDEIAEARRLLYVGMTRAKDRLVMTYSKTRRGKATGGYRFLTEMGVLPVAP